MTHAKICGILHVEDALIAADAGAAMLGFVFAPSRRRIEPERAADITARVRAEYDILAAGIFVDESAEEMNRVAGLCGLDYVQLSGGESEEVVAQLQVQAIQVIHMREDVQGEDLLRRSQATAAQIVLLDTAQVGSYGGTGTTFDWHRVPALPRPWILAGGLNPQNVGAAIRQMGPWGVDVSSGVETDGRKDPAKIRAFVAAVMSASPARYGWPLDRPLLP